MKVYFFVLICISQRLYSHAAWNVQSVQNQEPQCMSLTQTLQATQILCSRKNDVTLWQKVIDCHEPISEEFMRSNAEAQCPVPKYVQDPTDTRYTIQEVFLNFCGLVEGNVEQQAETNSCFMFGKTNPYVISHADELALVKSTWGNDLPCNIGFMRSNAEAQCPVPKYVQDPTDTRYTIQEVFLNFCGLVEGNVEQQAETNSCFMFGKTNPYVISHADELALVKSTWGNDLPCNIGKCILGLGIL